MARDSLKQREETHKMKAEIQRLDSEVNEWKLKNEEEKLTIQEIELALMKRKRQAEKCRRVATDQPAYKAMLEKMIRNTMHQEQVSLNQAAINTLIARLKAQMALCNSAETQLEQNFKLRDDLEKQMRPDSEQARKRSRTEDDDVFAEEKEDRTLICLPSTQTKTHKERRKFLEEEHMLSEGALSQIEEFSEEEETEQLPRLTLGKRDNLEEFDFKLPFAGETEIIEEDDEESRKERGKGNVQKWLQILLENTGGGDSFDSSPPKLAQEPEVSSTDEIIKKLNEKFPQKEIKVLKFPDVKKEASVEVEARNPRSMSTPRRSISTEPNNHEKKIEETIATEARKPRSVSTPRTRETDNTCKGSEAKKNVG